MEKFWRRTGVTLGRRWVVVAAVVVVVTALAVVGLTQVEFATGQDSYLNPESQVSIDNETFQDDFGGETVITLFSATSDDVDVADLFEGANLAELEEINAELAEIDEVYAVITPLTSLNWSDNLLAGGVGSNALIAASQRDVEGAEARQADIQIALARLGAAGEQVIGNPTYNDLLIYGDDGFTVVDGQPVAPPDDERVIRLSLASTFPDQQTAVGGVVLLGNADLDTLSAGTDEVLAVLEDATFEGFELTITGSPVYLAEINDYLQGGMLSLGLAAVVVMIVVLALMFRVRWRLLPLLSVLIGVVWSFSLLGLIGIDLSLVTISGLPILIGLGIDFAIQVHNRVEEEVVLDREEHPIAETLSNLAPPLIVATIAGVAAFLALRISKVPMIRDFGILLAIGIIILVVVGIVVTASALGAREHERRTEERPPSVVERVVVWLGGLPTAVGPYLVVASIALFVGGVIAEGSTKIQSDPVEWIDQGSQTVADVNRLEEETGFGTTLGVLVTANNVFDQAVVDLVHDFTVSAEARAEVVSSSSLVNTMGKIIKIPGATVIAPTSEDIVAAAAVMPPDIERVLLRPDGTATQANLRIAPSSLEERAVLVEELEDELNALIADLDLPADSVLLVDLDPGQEPVRATPAGLATVGIGLLENLSANRANLTYLALCAAALWLVLRLRSLSRALLGLVPVVLAVGVSSMVVGWSGIELSPLTTVSGPLVIATCAEFSVLILGRYLEERQRGLEPRDATNTAASRTGRAFFTSATTTIGGFAVLIGSALPLLRDFGIVVTLNVAIALLAALVVLPPLAVWVDLRGVLGTQEQEAPAAASVRLAAPFYGAQSPAMIAGAVVLVAAGIAVYATADTDSGESSQITYAAVALPTTTTTTTTTTTVPAGSDEPLIDPSTYGTERPASLVGGVLFDLLTSEGVEPNVANCTVEILASRVSDEELLALGAATLEPEAVAPIVLAAQDCGVDGATIEAAIEARRSGG